VLDRLLPEGRVEVEGGERFEAARAGGRGVVLLGLHLGNWEVATPLLASLSAPPTTFYEPPESRSRDYLSRRIRRRLGAVLLPLGLSGFKPALAALAAGEPVVLFADETRGGLVQAPFFDRPPHRRGNLALAVRLAREAGTLVQPGYVLRTEGARFRAVFLPPFQPTDDLAADVAGLNALIEPVVLAHLDQWYYLHFPIWREPGTEP
jgi:KDO2-lipid IV(A) lauroyltransferase